MSKNNREVLKTNRIAVLEFVNEVNAKDTIFHNFTLTRLSAIEKLKSIDLDSNQHEVDEALSFAIRKLDEAKDNRLGIVWQEKLDNGTKILVRDARNQENISDELLKEDAPEKYGMQLLSEVRGAIDLINNSVLSDQKKQEAKNELINVAKISFAQIDKFGPKSIKNYNSEVLDILESNQIDSAAEKLKFASEIAAFRDEHRHIVTLSKAVDNNGGKTYSCRS